MKLLSTLCENKIVSLQNAKIVICQHVFTPFGTKLLPEPVNACDHECEFCLGRNYFTPFFDPSICDDRVWLCANPSCDVYIQRSYGKETRGSLKQKRSLEWHLFCENSGIGDLFYDVKFEKIEQSARRVDYLLKFANKPAGIILMQGETGTGKTYASLGVCEFFTRTNSSLIFITQKKMKELWVGEDKLKFERRLELCNLLVVDDFGTGEIPPGFMTFFMDLINSRIQWSNRGTIISTNLSDTNLASYCGNALYDRIKTGQKMEFTDKSRRKPITL